MREWHAVSLLLLRCWCCDCSCECGSHSHIRDPTRVSPFCKWSWRESERITPHARLLVLGPQPRRVAISNITASWVLIQSSSLINTLVGFVDCRVCQPEQAAKVQVHEHMTVHILAAGRDTQELIILLGTSSITMRPGSTAVRAATGLSCAKIY